jgi:hypothetical protein
VKNESINAVEHSRTLAQPSADDAHFSNWRSGSDGAS